MRPLTGQTYTAQNGQSFTIEDASDGDETGFYLVQVIPTEDANDMSAMSGMELDPDEWRIFCTEHGLTLTA